MQALVFDLETRADPALLLDTGYMEEVRETLHALEEGDPATNALRRPQVAQ